jgi:hypothetical protein
MLLKRTQSRGGRLGGPGGRRRLFRRVPRHLRPGGEFSTRGTDCSPGRTELCPAWTRLFPQGENLVRRGESFFRKGNRRVRKGLGRLRAGERRLQRGARPRSRGPRPVRCNESPKPCGENSFRRRITRSPPVASRCPPRASHFPSLPMPQTPVTWNGLDSHGEPLRWNSRDFVWNGSLPWSKPSAAAPATATGATRWGI